jgi:hypothetical protein
MIYFIVVYIIATIFFFTGIYFLKCTNHITKYKAWIFKSGIEAESIGIFFIFGSLLLFTLPLISPGIPITNGQTNNANKRDSLNEDDDVKYIDTLYNKNLGYREELLEGDPIKLSRSFKLYSIYPSVLIRYRYKVTDTAYAIPKNFTLKELKFSVLEHFFPDRFKFDKYGVYYQASINNKILDESKSLDSLGIKDDDQLKIVRTEEVNLSREDQYTIHKQITFLHRVLNSIPYDTSFDTKNAIWRLQVFTGYKADSSRDKIGLRLFNQSNLTLWEKYYHEKAFDKRKGINFKK